MKIIKDKKGNSNFLKIPEWVLFSPEFGNQKDHHRVHLQPAQEHAPDQEPLAHFRDGGKIIHRPDHPESRADVAQGCDHRAERGQQIQAQYSCLCTDKKVRQGAVFCPFSS